MPGLSTTKEQKAFEKSVSEKVRRGGGEPRFQAQTLCKFVEETESGLGRWEKRPRRSCAEGRRLTDLRS